MGLWSWGLGPQNFVSRLNAASRGATITGYKATVAFDWYTNRIHVMDHMNKYSKEILGCKVDVGVTDYDFES